MSRFIDIKTLAKVSDLSLIGKTVAEGFLYGEQASRQRGLGLEFSQYRSYEVGDEISQIDWKLFARSDRYFVREATRESEIDIWFLLDASQSMGQTPFANDKDVSKFDYAKYLIASLAYLAENQGDNIGFAGLSSEAIEFLPLGNGKRHWHKLLLALDKLELGKQFPNAESLIKPITQMQRPAIIFMLSDFYQQQNEITDFLSKINTLKSDVSAFQMECSDEVAFDYKGLMRFSDLETGEEVLVSAADIKSGYLKEREHYFEELKTTFNRLNLNYDRFDVSKPLDSAVVSYLKTRSRLRATNVK